MKSQTPKVQSLKDMQSVELEIKQWSVALSTMKYSEGLSADLKKHLGRVQSLVRILGRAVSERVAKDEFPKLKKAINAVGNAHAEFRVMCARFGVQVRPSAKKRARKGETTE